MSIGSWLLLPLRKSLRHRIGWTLF
ncbi:MAG: hypothetical protein QOJ42_504, partial [Acidobacteriaceae bacterium]|nr:hypothetical protein [Acidobacteriaceae bacterium]